MFLKDRFSVCVLAFRLFLSFSPEILLLRMSPETIRNEMYKALVLGVFIIVVTHNGKNRESISPSKSRDALNYD